MEKTITNKMTFYDLVTLIVPSAWVLYAFRRTTLGGVGTENWLTYIALFGWLLMIGLVLKNIAVMWNGLWFRNNTDILVEEESKLNQIEETPFVCRLIRVFVEDPINMIVKPFGGNKKYHQNKYVLDAYYKAYCSAYSDSYYGKRIEIIESHIAFLQTWTLALVVSLFGCFGDSNFCICCLGNGCDISFLRKCLIGIGIYLCLVIISYIQRKVYSLIWESRTYVKTNDNNK